MSGARFRVALRLFLLVQWRSRFTQVYLGLALAIVVGSRLLLPEELAPLLVPAYLLGEPATLGVFLVAAHRMYERTEHSATALLVTPLGAGEYLAALAVASALVATAGGLITQGGILGADARLALLLPPLFASALLFGLVGFVVSSYVSEFTRFILASIPVIALLSLPFLAYFELTPRAATAWVPSDAALFAFENLARPAPDAARYALTLALLVLYTLVAFWISRRVFETRVRERLEGA